MNDHHRVSAAWLGEHLDSPRVRVIEVDAGDDAGYRAGHVPGAVRWPWKTALWHDTDREFPTAEVMAQNCSTTMTRSGVSPS
jgi:3-mercaptopyruvate sulfurtransferase SseA